MSLQKIVDRLPEPEVIVERGHQTSLFNFAEYGQISPDHVQGVVLFLVIGVHYLRVVS
jgi:hypothetical protein